MNKSLLFLTKLGAMSHLLDQIFVPDDSAVFVQMPGDRVVTGTLRKSFFKDGVPSWMKLQTNRKQIKSHDRVFLYTPAIQFKYLKASIGTILHEKNNTNVQGYKCFVKTEYAILKADLLQLPLDEQTPWPTTAHIYVRVPGHNLIYAGELEYLQSQNKPIWIH